MPDPRPVGYSRSMARNTAGSLNDYFAEIRAVEDEWYSRCRPYGRVLGSSLWDSHIDKLREIDARHGVWPDDPRVYSIAAYLAERKEIHEEWNRLCLENRNDAAWNSGMSQAFHAAHHRYWARLDDCKARHFPRLDSLRPNTIDTIPQLWAHITHHLLPVSNFLRTTQPAPPGPRPPTCSEDVQRAYSLLHQLQIPWAPAPPYPSFTQQEAIDELTRIANRLELEEPQPHRAGAANETPPPVPAPPPGIDRLEAPCAHVEVSPARSTIAVPYSSADSAWPDPL